jgi:uncharacterized protein YggE
MRYLLSLSLFGALVLGQNLPNRINVSGDALVEAAPDYAIVRLNLEAKDRLLKRARVAQDADIAAVRQTATRYKISGQDIQLDFPEIDSRNDGFYLRRTMQLTVRDLKVYDSMLFDLYDAAAVTVESVEFRVNDLKKFRDQAREAAVLAAQEKATNISQVMGRKLGRVLNVRVDAGGGTLVRRRGQGSDFRGVSQVTNYAADASGGGAEFFRVPVTAKVDAEYEILATN